MVVGDGQGALSIQKNKKITRTVHNKIIFYTIFIEFFFSTMAIKNFKYGQPGGLTRRGQGALSVQRSEKNHKNSTHTKFKFYLIFIKEVFLQWILKILQINQKFIWRGRRRQAWGWWNLFFWHISTLFHQCNNKNSIYQQFLLLFTLYILHIAHIDVFFSSPEKLTFGCKNFNISENFWPRWLKHTSFYREFNYQQHSDLQKIIFHVFP